MIRSMTGFGKHEVMRDGIRITVEMKSVNHKYLDVNIKIPRKLNMFEAGIRKLLGRYIARGKIDMYVSCEDVTGGDTALKYNEKIAGEYVAYSRRLAADFGIPDDMGTVALMKFPDVLSTENVEFSEDIYWEIMSEAVEGAVKKLIATKEIEGENLRSDLTDKLCGIRKNVDAIIAMAPRIEEEYKEKITERIKQLLDDTQIDNSRIAMEVTLFADKVCVDEETVRLQSHISGMTDVLKSGGEVGKRLDFIAQEMNREANTILSKTNSVDITNLGIELKTEIEKIREQIQNIE